LKEYMVEEGERELTGWDRLGRQQREGVADGVGSSRSRDAASAGSRLGR
jgi:hypothetical protein